MPIQFINDFQALTNAGADANFVVEKMSGSVNDFIQTAIRTGTEVPIAMQPMLQKMSEMGLLVGSTGEQIELSSLNWSMTMTQGFQQVATAIDHLAAALGYKLPAAARAAADGMNAELGRVRVPRLGYDGEIAPMRESGIRDSGGGGTAIIELEGQVLTEVIVPRLPGEVQRYGAS